MLKRRIDEINMLTKEEVAAEMQMACTEHRNHFYFKHRRADGTIRDVDVYSAPIVIEGKTMLYSIIHDITDHKRAEEEKRSLEERLHRAEKMEALGTMAGGVAHDLNNVLGVVSLYSELIQEKAPEESPIRKYATDILSQSQKASAIIEDLLTLARRGVSVSKVIDLNGILSNILNSAECKKLQDFHPSVILKSDLDKELFNINGSPVHLEKTVFNLLSNAAEAISVENPLQAST